MVLVAVCGKHGVVRGALHRKAIYARMAVVPVWTGQIALRTRFDLDDAVMRSSP